MISDGTTLLSAGPDAVRAVLTDPSRLIPALPNVEDFAWDDRAAGRFTATVRPRLALGDVVFRTDWTVHAPVPHAVTFEVEGRGEEHRLAMVLRLDIAAEGSGSRITWSADYAVSGTMRAVGQRVLPAIVAAQARLALAAVDRQAAEGPAAAV
ncbi:MAG: SRPBCC domain-containing protein [Patulibacter sp.]